MDVNPTFDFDPVEGKGPGVSELSIANQAAIRDIASSIQNILVQMATLHGPDGPPTDGIPPDDGPGPPDEGPDEEEEEEEEEEDADPDEVIL